MGDKVVASARHDARLAVPPFQVLTAPLPDDESRVVWPMPPGRLRR